MMGRHLLALDAEQDVLEAFASFDDGDKGWVKVDEVRKALREMGDRMEEREVSLNTSVLKIQC
jgi:myosin regulatory light chain 12